MKKKLFRYIKRNVPGKNTYLVNTISTADPFRIIFS